MSATLSAIAAELPGAEILGGDPVVVDATHDSRQVRSGWLFCAIPGSTTDGHEHADQALERGASALLVERRLEVGCPQLKVADARASTGPAAAVVHEHPSERLRVVGVTGTNGKTTLTYLLESAFAAAGLGTGVLGTVETRIHGQATTGVRTTPEGTDLQRMLATMWTRGVDAVAMEVSSHGLDLHRVDGTRFAVAVFTNLSRDHLDHHGTMEEYFAAKARLFAPQLSQRAVVCIDDDWGRRLAGTIEIETVTVGRDRSADARIVEEHLDPTAGRARVVWGDETFEVSTRIAGGFNLLNAVVAVVTAAVAGVELEAAVDGVANSAGAPGRLERLEVGQPFDVFVDYAHTPDAILGVIRTLRHTSPDARLLVVVGAGGDRDRDKRRPMGAAAAEADVVVVTSDNPRTEDPAAIIDVVAQGVTQARTSPELVVEPDRERAIGEALARARPGDVVVIAGKGHETTQQFADRTIDFDDREVACRLLARTADGSNGAGR